ncbi:hypothetical protein N7478_000204 [Penicillium angulare]|uniref:uncharacterized protein n=1 Tax=Penicillium angulare TaxID=116970 RepID=UPI0025403296|nr:uncharacterized protein N7478_000204 [Penicillium angulare]KAJ5290953.1 hypothetical protein N7478_000204 [Penicillium angulare]
MSDNPENMRGTRDTNARANDILAKNGDGNANANTNNTTQPDRTQTSQPTNANSNTTPHPSLAQRIQNSATGLARSAFADPSAAQVLSGATNGKTGSSTSSGISSTVAREAYRPSNSSLPSGRTEQTARGTSEAFRESDVQEGGFSIPALSEEEFQRGEHAFEDGNWSTPRSSEGSLQASNGNWKGKQRAHDPIQGEYTTAWDRANTNAQSTAGTAYYTETETDGAAVVSLLSSSSFDAGFTEPENELDPDAAPPPLTAEEIKLLDSFRRQMSEENSRITFPQTQTQSQPAHLSSLSLVPDIDTFLQQNDPSAYNSQTSRDGTSKSISLRDDVLAHLPGAEDWVGVHERYHDEVWGYLRPALEAAKVEIEENVEGTAHDGEGPAVRRLKMILEHMKI